MVYCKADYCFRRVAAGRIFCAKHWVGLPMEMRERIADAYVRGNETQSHAFAMHVHEARRFLGLKK